MYLRGGEYPVAYNPEDVSSVWLIEENGAYVKFEIIDSYLKGQNLSSVEQYIKASKDKTREKLEDNLQAKVSLSKDIDFIISETVHSKTSIKGIRKNREKEQELMHKDFLKEYDL